LNKTLSFLYKLLIAAAILSVSSAAIFLCLDYFKTKEAFPPKTFIGKVEVSHLNKEEAIEKIKASPIEDAYSPTITFLNPQNTSEAFVYSVHDLGAIILPEDTISRAFDFTHSSSYFKDLGTRFSHKNMVLPASVAFNEPMATAIVMDIESSIDSPVKEASIDLNEQTGGYHILGGLPARRLKVVETLNAAKKSIYEGYKTINLNIDYYEQPKISEKDLRAAPPVHRISIYTTYYGSHDSPNRIHNIKLIASWLNNNILMPNEVMSLTSKIGAFTPERGFKEAYVIMQGALVPQLGGGTCQIGTTLYNAAGLADLDILSRRNHSFYFNIYPLGRDATVYPGQADLKIKNNTGHPILIKTVANDKKLSFRIYGTTSSKEVEYSNPAVYILDPSGKFRPSSVREVLNTDRPFRTVVIRTVKDSSGKKIKEETIRSFYKLYGERTNVPIIRRESR